MGFSNGATATSDILQDRLRRIGRVILGPNNLGGPNQSDKGISTTTKRELNGHQLQEKYPRSTTADSLICRDDAFYLGLKDKHRGHQSTGMKILMDKALREIVEQAYEEARLGRDGEFLDPKPAFGGSPR